MEQTVGPNRPGNCDALKVVACYSSSANGQSIFGPLSYSAHFANKMKPMTLPRLINPALDDMTPARVLRANSSSVVPRSAAMESKVPLISDTKEASVSERGMTCRSSKARRGGTGIPLSEEFICNVSRASY